MRCALCPGKYNCVESSGPAIEGQPLWIGEAPGKDENNRRIPFVGKTGKEVDYTYLPAAGLSRPNCRFSNAISCYPDTSGHKLDPKNNQHLALLKSCTNTNLYPEIERLKPNVLIPMGSFACRAIDPEIDLELHHGMPLETDRGLTFPMYHPAQGIHDPKKMMMLRTDWGRLGKLFKGELSVPEDEYPEPDYEEATEYDVQLIDTDCDIACDTERSRRLGPYCLTYSQTPGQGRLIRAERLDLLALLQMKLSKWKARIWFHNWLYDWKNTDEMGLEFPHKCMRDTMVKCFHLGNLPQKLKVLAYRELGMTMQDFVDLVRPYSTPEVLEYYNVAATFEWPKPEHVPYRAKDGSPKIRKPQGMNTKFKRFFTDLEKNPDKDPFIMWTENWEESHAMLEDKLGPWPGMDIAHVPFELVKHYACRDADATIRLKSIIEHMEGFVRVLPQSEWRFA